MNTSKIQLSSILILFLILMAVGIRLHRSNSPLLEYHPTRQYRNAMVSRIILNKIEGPQSNLYHPAAAEMNRTQWLSEPPIMETLTAFSWHLIGDTSFWVPRAWGCFFWCVGGYFLWLLSQYLSLKKEESLFCLIFYLLFPFGILASRTFMVEPLMIFFYLLALLTLIRWQLNNRSRDYFICLFVGIFASICKPGFLFLPLIFTSLVTQRYLTREATRKQWTLTGIYCLTLIITTSAYVFTFIDQWAGIRFFPSLLLTLSFWRDVYFALDTVYGPWVLFLATLGWFLANKSVKTVTLGILIGYLAFCFVNTYLIRRIPHYHFLILPAVCVLVGVVTQNIFSLIQDSLQKKIPLNLILFLGSLLVLQKGRELFLHPTQGIAKSQPAYRVVDIATEIQTYREIGKAIDKNKNCAFLTHSYGWPLIYHSEIWGQAWYKAGDFSFLTLANQAILDVPFTNLWQQFQSQSPLEYFIVTDFREWFRQKQLRSFFENNHKLIEEDEKFLIYQIKQN